MRRLEVCPFRWSIRKLHAGQLSNHTAGRPFSVDKVNLEDLEAGVLNTSWALEKRHRAVSEEQHKSLANMVSIGILLSSMKGAWDVSDEWNQVFPDYAFDKMEDFLTRVWDGKP